MILPDVNVLLAAYRPDAGAHAICRTWLDDIIEAESAFGVSPLALAAVVRIATHPRIFEPPSEPANALAYCEDLLDQPHVVRVVPGERHWDIFTGLVGESGARGNLITDAWFAALAIEWRCSWITLDRDFAHFSGLDWRPPD